MKAYQLKFDNTCNENWNDMTPDQKGRFCNLCSKSVIDFTGKTPEEVLSYLKTNKNTCGRMTAQQLQQTVFEKEKDFFKIPYSKTAASFMIAASLGAVTLGNAQETVKTNTATFKNYVEDINSSPSTNQGKALKSTSTDQKQSNELATSFVEIKGTVLSKNTLKKLSHVKVTFYSLSNYVSTFTDLNGQYRLIIPQKLISNKNLISYDFTGVSESISDEIMTYNANFESVDIIISKNDLEIDQQILAENEVFYLGGVLFSNYTPQPIVYVNGEEVPYRILKRSQRGKETKINFVSKDSRFVSGHLAVEWLGKKAKDGAYLFYDKLSQ